MKRLLVCAASAVVSCSSLVALAGSSSSAVAPMAAATPGANAGGTFPRPRPGHGRIHAAPGVNSTSSSNWSGYVQAATESHTFTEVSDTMVVPTVVASANGVQYAISTGWASVATRTVPRDSTLVQDGIQTIATTSKGKTTVTYSAWTEILPQPEKALDFSVNAGDVVTATVREVARNKWKMTVDDTTTGQSATRTVKYRSKGLSAEAIHERPCIKGNCQSESDLATLADTTNVPFGPGSYSQSGPGATPVTEPLLGTAAGATLNEILMVGNDDATIATPSDPSTAQDAFAVAYGDTPPTPPSN